MSAETVRFASCFRSGGVDQLLIHTTYRERSRQTDIGRNGENRAKIYSYYKYPNMRMIKS